MDDSHRSVQDGKNRFSEVADAARGKPQTVAKHGKSAVAVVKAIRFKKHLLNMPKDGGSFERMK